MIFIPVSPGYLEISSSSVHQVRGTVNRYTDILEQTFLIMKLPPYYTNIRKRLVKSPKVYLRDSGLLHNFLGIHDTRTLEVHPSRGASWEGFVLEQIINAYSLQSPSYQPFYWRTARGVEVDLLMVKGRRIVPFEIKLRSSPTKAEATNLISCMKDLRIPRGYLLYPGMESYSLGEGVTVLPTESILGDPGQLNKLGST